MRRLAPFLVLAVLAGCGGGPGDEASSPSRDRFDAERAFRDLRAQVALGPRVSGSAAGAREVALIVRRLRRAGIPRVRVQRPLRNVVARIPGAKPGTVVVGAHHDTKDLPDFVGANDGASGVAVVLELARALPPRLEGPAIDLVFFDAEEPRGELPFDLDGSRGSRQFVRYAREGGRDGSPPLGEIRSMVLFDMVGDCDLAVPREANSDEDLYGRFADAARELTGDPNPFVGTAPAVADDHGAFLAAGVPAVDLIDYAFGPGPVPGAWWHTPLDDLRHVCASSLDAVGEPALAALPAIR
jgi:Zn-dependent M28 family amino/carboxypeptidase